GRLCSRRTARPNRSSNSSMPRCKPWSPIRRWPRSGRTRASTPSRKISSRCRPAAPSCIARSNAGAPSSATTTSRSASSEALARRLEHLFEPIPHIGGADALVVDLAVVVAALFAGEDFHRLLLRADGIEAFLRFAQRNLLIAVAVQHQERASDLLHDAI